MNTQRDGVVLFLSKFFDVTQVEDDTNFIKAGLINSLFAMQLIMHLENEFSIVVENEDMNPDNFNSITAIVRFIQSKQQQ